MSRLTDKLVNPLDGAAAVPEIGLLSDLLTLTKARLSSLVIVTTFVGFCMAERKIDWILLLHAIIGTTLAAASAAALNQWIETHVDRLMERTKSRPLPAGRMKPASALRLGIGLGVVGVAWLWVAANATSAILAAATVFIYLFIYTPLKRKTAICTIAGAVSGAIPPVIGWTAAQGAHPEFGIVAAILFGILFTWQMPHFLAIAWIYRDEYANAGFVMLKRDDKSGVITALTSLVFALGLFGICLAPYIVGMNNETYFIGTICLNGTLIALASHFLFQRARPTARRLFFGSIIYLPLQLGLLVLTKS